MNASRPLANLRLPRRPWDSLSGGPGVPPESRIEAIEKVVGRLAEHRSLAALSVAPRLSVPERPGVAKQSP
jgi:hypothetical protein